MTTLTAFALPTDPAAGTVIAARPGRAEGWWAGTIDGQSYGGLYATTEAGARAKAHRAAVTVAENTYLSPLTIAALNGYVATELELEGPPVPGQVVTAYTRQARRPVVVVKVGRKNTEVAATTPSNPGNVTRKTVPTASLTQAAAR